MKAFFHSKIIFFKKDTQSLTSVKNDCVFTFLSFSELMETSFWKIEYENEYKSRFHNGNLCAGLKSNNEIVHISWIARNALFINEIEKLYIIPQDSFLIYDVVTKESERGKGFYPFMLSCLLNWRNENNLINALIFSESINSSSIKGIKKADFKITGSISLLKVFGIKFYSKRNSS